MTALSQGLEVRPAASRFVSVGLVVVGGLMWLVVPFMSAYVVPKFVEIFHKFGTALPPITVVLIQACRLVSDFWYVAAAVWIGVVGVLALWSGRAASWHGVAVAGAFAAASLSVLVVVVALGGLALFLPLVHLIQEIGSR